MKQLETLARLHVNEAIQAGLASQSIHRALSENSDPARPAARARVVRFFVWLGRLAARASLALRPGTASTSRAGRANNPKDTEAGAAGQPLAASRQP